MSKLRISLIWATLLPFVLLMTPAQAQTAIACGADAVYAGSRLVGGAYARVTPGEPNNVRESPSSSTPLVAQIEPGQVVYVTSAPTCAEGYVWWQVMYRLPESTDDFPFGYTVEGASPLSAGDYWLEPAPQSLQIAPAAVPITAANIGQLQQGGQVEHGLISGFKWSEDSRFLAVNSVGAVWVYDTNTAGAMPTRLTLNSYDTNSTFDIAFAGDTVATAGGVASVPNSPMSGVANLWSLANPVQPITQLLEPDQDFGGAAAVSPDLTRAAFEGTGGVINLWDITSQSQIASLNGHTLIGTVKFSPDGTMLISAGEEGMGVADTTLRLWDAATGTQRAVLENIGSIIPTLTFSRDGSTLAVATYTFNGSSAVQTVQVIDVPSFTVKWTITLPGGSTSGLSFSPDGALLAVSNSFHDDTLGGWASRLRFYDTATQAEVSSLVFTSDVGTVAFSPDGTKLALVYADPLFWGPNRATIWTVP